MRRWLKRIFVVSVVLAVIFGVCLAYAYFIEPRKLVLNSQELKIKGLDPAFDGLKVVAIGDVHGGSNGVDDQKLHQIVALSNLQQPDIIVLLGDYVSRPPDASDTFFRPSKMPIEEVATGLSGFEAKLGVFVVLGNHDSAYGDERVAKAFTDVGYKVLQNEVAAVVFNGHRLRLLGYKDHLKLDYPWEKVSADSRQWLASSGEGQVIALEHSPDILPMITGDLSIGPDLKLILAAHTHGGQVWLPIIGTPVVPSSYGQKYSYGHIRDQGVDMFVTSGVGESILPIRFMMPPEIAVLTLRSE